MKAPLSALPRRVLDRAGLARDAWVSTQPAVFREIGAGDAVVARGVLRRRGGGEGRAGYRQSAASWNLCPVPPDPDRVEASSVLLAAERPPRVGGPIGGPALAGACAGLAIFAVAFVGLLPATADLRGASAEEAARFAATPLRRAEAVDAYRAALEREVNRGGTRPRPSIGWWRWTLPPGAATMLRRCS